MALSALLGTTQPGAISPGYIVSTGGTTTTSSDPGSAIVTLAEVRDHLNFASTDTSNDAELMRFALAATEVAAEIGGIVQQQTTVEQHDGGRATVALLLPVVQILSVIEYLGTTPYLLTPEPFGGSSYSNYGYTVEGQILTRRNQGFPRPFMGGRRNVIVTYTAGTAFISQKVKLGVLELIRDWWAMSQQTRQGPALSRNGYSDTAAPRTLSERGYAVPNAVVQLLSPDRRPTGIA